jgi:hypothetical protein
MDVALKPVWLKAVTLSVAAAVALWALPNAGANHGDIHAVCEQNDVALIIQRPPGTEHVRVICRDGTPEYFMEIGEVPAYQPERQPLPAAMPDDFGGWATVTLNGRTLHVPYDPFRGIPEPGAYLAASTGRVLMPVRFFTEALGGQVQWWPEYRQVQLTMPGRDWPVTLWLGEDYARQGDTYVPLDQRPVLFLDRTFVPVRFLVEAFGGEVVWDEASRTVRIELDGLTCDNRIYCGE